MFSDKCLWILLYKIFFIFFILQQMNKTQMGKRGGECEPKSKKIKWKNFEDLNKFNNNKKKGIQ